MMMSFMTDMMKLKKKPFSYPLPQVSKPNQPKQKPFPSLVRNSNLQDYISTIKLETNILYIFNGI